MDGLKLNTSAVKPPSPEELAADADEMLEAIDAHNREVQKVLYAVRPRFKLALLRPPREHVRYIDIGYRKRDA